MNWETANTSTHQDRVIAHVLGTTVLGYFVIDETIHLLLDIGFIWSIYLDGEMNLLPHPVAINEMSLAEDDRLVIQAEIDALLRDGGFVDSKLLKAPPVQQEISEVEFQRSPDRLRFELRGPTKSLFVECAVDSRQIVVSAN